jgi:hypothetical protein
MKFMLLLLVITNLTGTDLNLYRRLLDKSLNDESAAKQLFNQLKRVDGKDEPVLLGFRAMSEFMLCKHLLNPISRISHFNKGKGLLEAAIKKDTLNPELLYFRLSTQSNIPSLLRYKMNIAADKARLINYLKAGSVQPVKDRELYQRIRSYLLINPFCSLEEKAMIRNLQYD